MNPLLKKYFIRLKENAIKDGLKYFVYERNNESELPYSVHFRFISKEGYSKDSWGAGFTLDEAFGKALMEMIERIYFSNYSPFYYQNESFFLKKSMSLFDISYKFMIPIEILHPGNTNGVAIHINKSKAKKNAKLELIERHTILYALGKAIGPKFRKVLNVSSQKTAEFFIYPSSCNTFTTIGALTENNGTFFSSGCDSSIEESILKAKLELNSFIYLKENNEKNFKIIKDDIQSFNLYHKYSGDLSAVNFLRSTPFAPLPELKSEEFFYTFIPTPHLFNGLNDLSCVRVIHPDAQQLFFDNWKMNYINPRLFSSDESLPSFPHIIA